MSVTVGVWVARDERMLGSAVEQGATGAEAQVYARPDKKFAALMAGVGVPQAPIGRPTRPLVTGGTPTSAADLPRRAAELVAPQFDTFAAAAEECHAPATTGVMPTGGWR